MAETCSTNFDFVANETDCVAPSCAALLCTLTDAYYRLVTGNKEVKVEYRDHSVWYTPATLSSLKSEIAKLHSVCGSSTSAAILGGTRRARGVQFGRCGGGGCHG